MSLGNDEADPLVDGAPESPPLPGSLVSNTCRACVGARAATLEAVRGTRQLRAKALEKQQQQLANEKGAVKQRARHAPWPRRERTRMCGR